MESILLKMEFYFTPGEGWAGGVGKAEFCFRSKIFLREVNLNALMRKTTEYRGCYQLVFYD